MSKDRAQTVLGPLPVDELGVTMCHEHSVFDLSCYAGTQDGQIIGGTGDVVSIKNLGELRRDPTRIVDNLIQRDAAVAAQELACFKLIGGRTVVDCTTIGIGRDVRAIRSISEMTGLNIIAGTGYYIGASHPKELDNIDAEEISRMMTKEIESGVEDSGIKCGIIGEIGTSWPLTPNEKKVLKAAAYTQKKTGAPISVHITTFQGRYIPEVIKLLKDENADMTKVILGHIDEGNYDEEYLREIGKSGCFLECDTFGLEVYFDSLGAYFPCDAERVITVRKLVKLGYGKKILLSQDVCLKTCLKRYGGYGYDHVLKDIVPMMKKSGLSPRNMEEMLVENPKSVLGF